MAPIPVLKRMGSTTPAGARPGYPVKIKIAVYEERPSLKEASLCTDQIFDAIVHKSFSQTFSKLSPCPGLVNPNLPTLIYDQGIISPPERDFVTRSGTVQSPFPTVLFGFFSLTFLKGRAESQTQGVRGAPTRSHRDWMRMDGQHRHSGKAKRIAGFCRDIFSECRCLAGSSRETSRPFQVAVLPCLRLYFLTKPLHS